MSRNQKTYQNKEVLDLLGQIYQIEAAGINRYLHYSFMIMGYNRIPIQKWFRDNAAEAMTHSIEIGEKITSLGCLLYTSPSPRDQRGSRMPSSA